MARNVESLLWDSRVVLDIGSQGELGQLLGSSVRSGQRWARGEARPLNEQLHRLALLVYPKNAALAAEIAELTGTTLERLGLGAPAPPAQPPPSPAPPLPDPIHIVDTVVCAAAEAMQVMPDAIRPALRAAFRRARLAGLSVDAVDAALGRPNVSSERSPEPGAGDGTLSGGASPVGRASRGGSRQR